MAGPIFANLVQITGADNQVLDILSTSPPQSHLRLEAVVTNGRLEAQLQFLGEFSFGSPLAGAKLLSLLQGGTLILRGTDSTARMQIDGNTGRMSLGPPSSGPTVVGQVHPVAGTLSLRRADGSETLLLDSETESVQVGRLGSIQLDGAGGNITLSAGGKLFLKGPTGAETVMLDGSNGNLLGGKLFLHRTDGTQSVLIDGSNGTISLGGTNGNATLLLDGTTGDITLKGADCAEQFEIDEQEPDVGPGTVLVIHSAGRLVKSRTAYDKRVAGVISGAGECKPAIVMNRGERPQKRATVAVSGKVYCKVDAAKSPIDVGDLLTTSTYPGHAMKATKTRRAFGAVIGKALGSLKKGRGLIPILVALQ